MTWVIWLTIAVVLVICEIATSSVFFCLCLSIGSVFAAGASYLFNSNWIEIMVFIIVSILSLYFVRPFFKKMIKKSKTIESNVDALIGAEAIVTSKITPFSPGFVKVFGEIWRAESIVEILEGETVKIKRINGTTLTVEK
ncbi:MAG: NfeD family protein [Endomicrobium sp.]|jgi:membrane protein implicated in regulation of membrane protease activity|nr:NfeD family protein [Endomicrobium sp.]MDR2644623.1 NfeD family protein [Endomicrobium sp.]